jgi:hypothetical protein
MGNQSHEELDIDSWLEPRSSREERDTTDDQDIILAVHMTDNDLALLESPSGFRCEPESESDLIRKFCYRQKEPIPYDWPFVSVAICYAKEDPSKSAAYVYGLEDSPNSLSAGHTIILTNQAVVPDLMVVCTADFKTTVWNAAKKQNAGQQIGSYIKQFRVLSGETNEEKTRMLFQARQDSDSGKYPEARLHRHIFDKRDVREKLKNSND